MRLLPPESSALQDWDTSRVQRLNGRLDNLSAPDPAALSRLLMFAVDGKLRQREERIFIRRFG